MRDAKGTGSELVFAEAAAAAPPFNITDVLLLSTTAWTQYANDFDHGVGAVCQ